MINLGLQIEAPSDRANPASTTATHPFPISRFHIWEGV